MTDWFRAKDDEIRRLRTEVEQLQAAGDALAEALSDYGYGGDWEVLKAWEEARRG